MTGSEIRALREALGIDPTRFAALVGVAPSSLYRWEAKRADPVTIDPMQQQILTLLQHRLAEIQNQAARDEFVKGIVTALLIGGGLFALYKLLDATFGNERR